MFDFDEDDQDEWDFLSDETLRRTIQDDPVVKIRPGDRVKVVSGQFLNCRGFVKTLSDGMVTFMTEERKPMEVKVKVFLVSKCFDHGEQVRIIQGNKAGEDGIISRVI